MRSTLLRLILLAAAGLAPPAAEAQVLDAQGRAQANAAWGQQDALRQSTLDAERQAFAAEQRLQTQQTLQSLSASRQGASLPSDASPPASATLAARADAIARQQAEADAMRRTLHPTPQ